MPAFTPQLGLNLTARPKTPNLQGGVGRLGVPAQLSPCARRCCSGWSWASGRCGRCEVRCLLSLQAAEAFTVQTHVVAGSISSRATSKRKHCVLLQGKISFLFVTRDGKSPGLLCLVGKRVQCCMHPYPVPSVCWEAR